MANWYHIVPLVPLPQKNCFPVSSFTTSYFQDSSSVHLVSLIEFCNQKCYGGNHHPGYFALDNIAFTSACNSHRLCWVTNAWRILLPTHSLHFSCLLDFFFLSMPSCVLLWTKQHGGILCFDLHYQTPSFLEPPIHIYGQIQSYWVTYPSLKVFFYVGLHWCPTETLLRVHIIGLHVCS